MKKLLLLLFAGLLATTTTVSTATAVAPATPSMQQRAFNFICKQGKDPLRATKQGSDGKISAYASGIQQTALVFMAQQIPLLTEKRDITIPDFLAGTQKTIPVVTEYLRYFIPTDGSYSHSLQSIFNTLCANASALKGGLTLDGTIPPVVQAFEIIQFMLNCYFDGLPNLAELYQRDNSYFLEVDSSGQKFSTTDPLSRLYNHMIDALPKDLPNYAAVATYMVDAGKDCKSRYFSLSQKPLVMTTGKAERMIALLKKNIAPLTVGLTSTAYCCYMDGGASLAARIFDGISTGLIHGALTKGVTYLASRK